MALGEFVVEVEEAGVVEDEAIEKIGRRRRRRCPFGRGRRRRAPCTGWRGTWGCSVCRRARAPSRPSQERPRARTRSPGGSSSGSGLQDARWGGDSYGSCVGTGRAAGERLRQEGRRQQADEAGGGGKWEFEADRAGLGLASHSCGDRRIKRQCCVGSDGTTRIVARRGRRSARRSPGPGHGRGTFRSNSGACQ